MGHTSTATLFTGLIFATFAASASATQTGQIHGVVTDKAGKPLEKVTVTLVGPATSGRPTTTNEHGEFRFFHLYPGTYTVWADEHGPRVAWRGIGVRVGVTSRVTLTVRTAGDADECGGLHGGASDTDGEPAEDPPAAPASPPKSRGAAL